MPMRVYSEDRMRKRKIFSNDEKPTRKYTKTIKEEIKKEPLDLSDNDDIDGDDVMDIEEADGTLPKKGKMNVVKKRLMKKKNVKKVIKVEKEKEQKDKLKPKRKKKIPQAVQQVANTENNIQITNPTASINPVKNNVPVEPSKPARKVTKIKERKVNSKFQKPNNKKPSVKDENTKASRDSDSDSSPEEDAYETCGVLNCTRPSGMSFD